jgi:hypothetical protein
MFFVQKTSLQSEPSMLTFFLFGQNEQAFPPSSAGRRFKYYPFLPTNFVKEPKSFDKNICLPLFFEKVLSS